MTNFVIGETVGLLGEVLYYITILHCGAFFAPSHFFETLEADILDGNIMTKRI
jgi:hypothetical protein